MGLNLKYQMKKNIPINFSKDEISTYIKRFRSLDSSNKGYITHKDLKTFFKVNLAFELLFESILYNADKQGEKHELAAVQSCFMMLFVKNMNIAFLLGSQCGDFLRFFFI
jgi:Ca2+-binding EF-hand superfamily protein